jgi:hypothetical protein
LSLILLPLAAACSQSGYSGTGDTPTPVSNQARYTLNGVPASPPRPDPRVGLKAGRYDAAEAVWNMRVLSKTPPTEKFARSSNSDLAFTGNYVIQGNYNGWQIWDIGNPSRPVLKTAYYCPASQSDVSTYQNLLFVSGEGTTARLDCGDQGVPEVVSKDRLRGLRIFDISDISNPKNVGNVQTCRGSHTHTVVVDPKDKENVYVYISGSAGVRHHQELPGCIADPKDPNSAHFRIEAIKIPLAHPERAAVVSSPRIFGDLTAPARHGEAPEDIAASKRVAAAARARGAFTVELPGMGEWVVPDGFAKGMLDSVVAARKGTGAATGADSAALRAALPGMIQRMFGMSNEPGPRPGPTSCHDITVYPAIGLAGGACEGYGLLIDISNPADPRRIAAVSDSNFSYWHSATFSNDGTKILFTDEWGGGGGAKCRVTDKPEWGANAIFTIENKKMIFKSYFKLPAPQTPQENCVAHNGSLIPIPGRDVMIQGWYQGGLSLFDWTDPSNPIEIGFFDRGPVDSTRMANGGSWSVYWYNGVIVSSEISRGLDILELVPSAYMSQNEIDAAKTVKLTYLNAQGQPIHVWPPSFPLARAYADQLERTSGLSTARLAAVRQALSSAESASGAQRRDALAKLASELDGEASGSRDAARVRKLAAAARDLAKS